MVQFSTRMDLLKGSEIRELLKLTAQPDIISFAGGMPAPELFPSADSDSFFHSAARPAPTFLFPICHVSRSRGSSRWLIRSARRFTSTTQKATSTTTACTTG